MFSHWCLLQATAWFMILYLHLYFHGFNILYRGNKSSFIDLYLHLYFHGFNILYRRNRSSFIDEHRKAITAQWFKKKLITTNLRKRNNSPLFDNHTKIPIKGQRLAQTSRNVCLTRGTTVPTWISTWKNT